MSPLPPLPSSSSPQRFALLSSTRYLLWLALACAALLGAFATLPWLRLSALVAAGVLIGLSALSLRYRPTLVVDDEGYAVESAGRRRFSVAWSAVQHVRHDPAEQALYIDCGVPAHNLLLPPQAGYAFGFEQRDVLYQRLLSYVGERAEIVARLDGSAAPTTAKADATAKR